MKKMKQLQNYTKTALVMGTSVTFHVVSSSSEQVVEETMKKAMHVFHEVENSCSRFDAQSELSKLTVTLHQPVPVSTLLFEILSFALETASLTKGAFDPTLGRLLSAHGFDRHYLTGEQAPRQQKIMSIAHYKDVVLHRASQTVLLKKPLMLDLGAVAKGFAVDLAAQHFQRFHGFYINAGGDLYVGGRNDQNDLWRIGIQHPYKKEDILCSIKLTDSAICTSGSYERPSKTVPFSHHLLNPRTGRAASDYISTTVIAPYAMAADAFSTAAFVLGRTKGKAFLEKMGYEAILADPSLTIELTEEMEVRHEEYEYRLGTDKKQDGPSKPTVITPY